MFQDLHLFKLTIIQVVSTQHFYDKIRQSSRHDVDFLVNHDLPNPKIFVYYIYIHAMSKNIEDFMRHMSYLTNHHSICVYQYITVQELDRPTMCPILPGSSVSDRSQEEQAKGPITCEQEPEKHGEFQYCSLVQDMMFNCKLNL
jgi:hypothetical protein